MTNQDENESNESTTDTILDLHNYEELSYSLNRIVYIPLPDRIKYLSFVMFGFASLYPLLVLIPDYLKQVYFSQGVAVASPSVANFTLIGIVLATIGFAGFCLALYLRKEWWDEDDEHNMVQLIGIEDVSTVFALGNGGSFAALTLLIGLGAYFDVPVFRHYAAELFQQTAMVSVQTVFIIAFTFGITAYALSHYSRFYLSKHGMLPEATD